MVCKYVQVLWLNYSNLEVLSNGKSNQWLQYYVLSHINIKNRLCVFRRVVYNF